MNLINLAKRVGNLDRYDGANLPNTQWGPLVFKIPVTPMENKDAKLLGSIESGLRMCLMSIPMDEAGEDSGHVAAQEMFPLRSFSDSWDDPVFVNTFAEQYKDAPFDVVILLRGEPIECLYSVTDNGDHLLVKRVILPTFKGSVAVKFVERESLALTNSNN